MNSRSKATLALVLSLTAAVNAQTPPFRWAVSAGGGTAQGIAIDPAGNLLVTGRNTVLNSSGGFLAKYDTNGVVLNAIQTATGTNVWNHGSGVAVDGAGNICLVGMFNGSATFGTNVLYQNGVSMFLAKYDTNLNLLWVTNSDGGEAFTYGIAVDKDGDSYITGNFAGVTTFGSITVDSGGVNSDVAFIAKFDPTGNCLWAEDIGVSGSGFGIVVDSATNVLVTGIWYFGGAFTAKYDPNGNNLWFQQRADNPSASSRPIATDPSGNVYVTGSFIGDMTFGSCTLSSSNRAVFVGKYDSDGNPLWALQSSGAAARAQEIVVDASGNSFIVGGGETGSIFGAATLVTTNLFVAKVSSDGNWRWVKQPGGNGFAQSYALALDPSGSLYFGGYFRSSPVNFDSAQLNTPGLFVAELDDQPPSPALTATGSTNGGLRLSWPAFPNGVYRVQYKPTIDALGWTDLAPDVTATSNPASFIDFPGFDSQRYYRVVLMP
jgi:hypothetical protein